MQLRELDPGIDKVQGFPAHRVRSSVRTTPQSFLGLALTLLRNDDGRFTDISEESGIQVRTPDQQGASWPRHLASRRLDVDGDGLVDIAVANDTVQNFLFHNLGKGKFEES